MKLFKNENFWFYLSIALLIVSALLMIFIPESFLSLALQLLGAVVAIYSIISIVRLSQIGGILISPDAPIYIALLILGIFVLISPTSAIMLVTVGFGLYYIISGVLKITKMYHLLQSNIYKKSDFIPPSLSVALGIVLLFFGGAAIKIASVAIGVIILFKTALMIIEYINAKKASKKDAYIEADFIDKSDK